MGVLGVGGRPKGEIFLGGWHGEKGWRFRHLNAGASFWFPIEAYQLEKAPYYTSVQSGDQTVATGGTPEHYGQVGDRNDVELIFDKLIIFQLIWSNFKLVFETNLQWFVAK